MDVYKDGGLVDRVAVDKRSWHVLGRDGAKADLVLAHPSLSRAHAAIGQDADGNVHVSCAQSSFSLCCTFCCAAA
jgi:hypothetical protein